MTTTMVVPKDRGNFLPTGQRSDMPRMAIGTTVALVIPAKQAAPDSHLDKTSLADWSNPRCLVPSGKIITTPFFSRWASGQRSLTFVFLRVSGKHWESEEMRAKIGWR